MADVSLSVTFVHNMNADYEIEQLLYGHYTDVHQLITCHSPRLCSETWHQKKDVCVCWILSWFAGDKSVCQMEPHF